jgi:2'-5' RNA ligase
MNLTEHYDRLYEKSSKAILEGGYLIDNQIDSLSDNRFGITLLIRPDEQITSNVQASLEELKAIDQAQYYYPASDMHVTVLSIISCYAGFELSRISIQDYVNVIQESLAGIGTIDIRFTGITASPSAVMIQGFPCGNALEEVRDRLRSNFRGSGLEESIDTRYTLATAHVTAMRFRAELKNSERFVAALERYRQHDFGHLQAQHLELVYNDWYQRERFVRRLHTFSL